MRRIIPFCRLQKLSSRAVVSLDGRDRYLGKHGTEARREKYRRGVADWLSSRVVSAGRAGHADAATTSPTVAEPIVASWRHGEA